MVPAMKKAVAFVTDEGGITCHAAIISRELKIPCVLGTQIGTKVLKDGDMVEVDADKGVVRVLESKKKDSTDLDIPKREEYDLTFESQGTQFIFEDLVAEFYDFADTITLCRDSIKSSYVSKNTLEQTNKEGLRLSVAELKKITASLDKTIKQAIKETLAYKKKKDFSKSDAKHMFVIMAKICKEYLYFDFGYWDDTFKKSQIDKKIKEKVDLVQNNKNKLGRN
jgi:hypothetical protein